MAPLSDFKKETLYNSNQYLFYSIYTVYITIFHLGGFKIRYLAGCQKPLEVACTVLVQVIITKELNRKDNLELPH